MKKLHIVNPYNSFAMQRMVAPILQSSGFMNLYRMTESEKPEDKVDLNYFVPWHGLAGDVDLPGKKAMLYTHCNPPDIAALQSACANADAIVAMSFTGRKELLTIGADPAKVQVIYAGSGDFALRRRNIGVIAFAQPNGRKRQHLLIDLAWKLNSVARQCLNFVLMGNGWEDIAAVANNAGLQTQLVEIVDDGQLQSLYNNLDFLLLTGLAEGGSLPMLEALRCGLPVIAPAVGYAADFPEMVQVYHSDIELIEILEMAIQPLVDRQLFAQSLNWRQYELEHALLFGRLLNQSVDIYPEYGMSRYSQLLGLIEQIHPKTICEIGTWNGNNALRMLQAAAKFHPMERLSYLGFDLFEQASGEQVFREHSKIPVQEALVEMRLRATGAGVILIVGDTRDTLALRHPEADFYFIDGGHSYETVQSDWENIQLRMPQSAVTVFDDYYTAGGKPGIGCNRVVDNLPSEQWSVEHLPVVTEVADGKICMAKVMHA